MKKIIFSYIFIFTFLVGCVGSIKSANSINTNSKTNNTTVLSSFTGIESAVAIADSKVDVFFPIISEDLTRYSFVIRYSGQQTPIYVAADQVSAIEHLNTNNERVFSNKFTVTGLNVATYYEFSVELRDIKTSEESSNNKLVTAKTFSNMTAQFNGITELKNLPGALGVNGIKVSWVEAEVRGSTISKNEVDPMYYVVTVLDASTSGIAKKPTDMNDVTINDSSRTLVYVESGKNNIIINGLRGNTLYYVQVRAVHYGYTSQVKVSNEYKLEENINYKSITTYSQNQSPTLNATAKASFRYTYPPGANAYNSVNLFWDTPVGVFDHYRIYFNTTGDIGTTSCNISDCIKISSEQTSTIVVGLEKNTKYKLNLLACLSFTCDRPEDYLTFTPIEYTSTPPEMDNYSGILSIDMATSLDSLDKAVLNLGLPDFTSGYIAGVDIFGCHSSTSSNCDPNSDSNPLSASTPLGLDPAFDYSSDISLEISGIDSSSAFPYCFLAKPFVWNGLEKKYTNALLSTVKCKLPSITAPSFAGFNTDSTCDLLVWNRPSNGIFDTYEIYYREKDSAEQTSLALSLGDYKTLIINNNLTNFSVSNLILSSGKYYDFGIRTLYRSSLGTNYWIRSANTTVETLKRCGPY